MLLKIIFITSYTVLSSQDTVHMCAFIWMALSSFFLGHKERWKCHSNRYLTPKAIEQAAFVSSGEHLVYLYINSAGQMAYKVELVTQSAKY